MFVPRNVKADGSVSVLRKNDLQPVTAVDKQISHAGRDHFHPDSTKHELRRHLRAM